MRTVRLPLMVTAILVAALALAACGGSSSSLPGNAVASVNGDPITKEQFTHWMTVAAYSQQTTSTASKVPVPDPPDYTKCIAYLRQTTPKPAKGKPTPTDAQFKSQCAQQYSGLRDQVLNFLISADWLKGEASDQKVSVSDKEVQTAFDKTKKQSFPKASAFQSFLQRTGYTTGDLLLRQRIQLLQQKIVAKVTKGTGTVNNAQIAAYYDKNKSRFAQPERRDLRIVLTKTAANAQKAKAAIESGQSFATVAKKYSIDQASKSQG